LVGEESPKIHRGTLVVLYYNNLDIQDEMIVGEIWGKTPYYEWDDRYVLRLILLFFIPIFFRILFL